MRLVVGLGNPGPKYEMNRHNIGFLAVDAIVRRHSFGTWRARFQGHAAEGTIGGEKVMILKPATFMNESGRSVGEAVRFFKLDPVDVIVLYDELDLAPSKIRVKQAGGNGGHNGLRSMDAHIGKDYWRVRLGIGHPGHKDRVVGHVLSDFAKSEWPDFERLIDAVSDRIDLMLAGNTSDFMSKVSMDLSAGQAMPRKAQQAVKAPKSDVKSQAPTPHEPVGGLAGQLKRWMSGEKKG